MMCLSVKAEMKDQVTAQVAWFVGLERHGVLDIDLGTIERDQLVAAELAAIRYLIFQKAVFKVVPKFGRGLKVQVTSGAIKKLMNGTSTKKHLRPYALFTRPRLAQATLAVARDLPSMATHVTTAPPVEIISIGSVFASWFEPFHINGVGDIHITNHAAMRYEQRVGAPELKDPIDSLLNRLMHKEFAKLEMPAAVIAHKTKKYGSDQMAEIWGHPESTMRFLISRNKPGASTLLTVFRIDPDQRYL